MNLNPNYRVKFYDNEERTCDSWDYVYLLEALHVAQSFATPTHMTREKFETLIPQLLTQGFLILDEAERFHLHFWKLDADGNCGAAIPGEKLKLLTSIPTQKGNENGTSESFVRNLSKGNDS